MVLILEKDIKISLLLDFYGSLLTVKQARAIELYYNDDFSLTEVAADLSITRQGAYDLISRGCDCLNEYEASLGLLDRFTKLQNGLETIKQCAINIESVATDLHTKQSAQDIITIATSLADAQQ